jgi:hypothetical protein
LIWKYIFLGIEARLLKNDGLRKSTEYNTHKLSRTATLHPRETYHYSDTKFSSYNPRRRHYDELQAAERVLGGAYHYRSRSPSRRSPSRERDSNLRYRGYLREQSAKKMIQMDREDSSRDRERVPKFLPAKFKASSDNTKPGVLKKTDRVRSASQQGTNFGSRNGIRQIAHFQEGEKEATFGNKFAEIAGLDQFLSYIEKCAMYERELEVVRQNLCLRADFVALDNFRLIDKRSTGFLTRDDV